MPIYEYRCEDCSHTFDTLQKISESPLTTCPQCNKEALQKLVSAAGFRLKGTGWYETDFKDSKKKPEANSGKSESKSAAKTTSTSKATSAD